MHNMYKDFLQEATNQKIIEVSNGFLTYRIIENFCYVEILYVAPKSRKFSVGDKLFKLLLEEIKDLNLDRIICEINPDNKDATKRIVTFWRYGFQVGYPNGKFIVMGKEL